MITAEEAYKKVKQNLVILSDIEDRINNAIENNKFEIKLYFQIDNDSKIYKILFDHFTPLGYKVSKYYVSHQSMAIKINWDLE